MRAGDFFVTSGEVLFGKYGIESSGPQRVFSAEVEWTFPLEFVELVWGDGTTTGAVSHFHTHFNEQLSDAGTIDLQPTWLPVFRGLGINIAMMSDFHSDGHPSDPGPLRLKEQKVYFEGCRRHSDRSFLIMPGEEPDAFLGGHYTTIFPRPVYWTHVRQAGQPTVEQSAEYVRVYHVGSEAEELEMLRAEQGSGRATQKALPDAINAQLLGASVPPRFSGWMWSIT
jgi:hypothetical protein